jgi:hypothetical protein
MHPESVGLYISRRPLLQGGPGMKNTCGIHLPHTLALSALLVLLYAPAVSARNYAMIKKFGFVE